MPGGGFVIVCADVTHRRQLDRLKDEFVSTVSHELRTPLTAISDSLRLLSSAAAGPLPARASQLLESASKNSERLATLVAQLLAIGSADWARPTRGGSRIEVGDLLCQAMAETAPTAELSGNPVTLTGPMPEVAVAGDRGQLLQALGNLLSNAVRFSSPGQPVEVSAVTTAAGTVQITVSDQGSGIPEAFRARVFDRFAQADGSDQRPHDGAGLGL